MRKFSRWMPPTVRSQLGIAGGLVVAGILIAVVAALITWPVPVGLALGILVVFQFVGYFVHNRLLRCLTAKRTGEDIGTFARTFNRRSELFDPWVLRATWDALEPYVVFRGGRLPLRRTDHLVDDLCIDPDDIAPGLFQEVAERSGRSLDQTVTNPFYGQVETVGDFVRFLTLQPRVTVKEKPRSE